MEYILLPRPIFPKKHYAVIMMEKRPILWIVSCLAVMVVLSGLTGCVTNNYESFYASNSRNLSYVEQKPVKYPHIDELFYLDEVQLWRKKGYEVIGQSSFRGLWTPRTKAIDVARKHQAEVVLVYYKLEEERKESATVVLPQTSTTYHHGSISGPPGVTTSYSGYSTSVSHVPVTLEYMNRFYSQRAFYLAKRKMLNSYGIYFLLPENVPGRPENEPVVIDVVLEDSPAEKSGLKAGDVIQSINGKPIPSFEEAKPYMFGQEEIIAVEVKHD